MSEQNQHEKQRDLAVPEQYYVFPGIVCPAKPMVFP